IPLRTQGIIGVNINIADTLWALCLFRSFGFYSHEHIHLVITDSTVHFNQKIIRVEVIVPFVFQIIVDTFTLTDDDIDVVVSILLELRILPTFLYVSSYLLRAIHCKGYILYPIYTTWNTGVGNISKFTIYRRIRAK